MTFAIDRCPRCGAEAQEIVETLTATASISRGEDGSFDYSGDSRIDWDSQQPREDSDGNVTLLCPRCAFAWATAIGEDV